MDHGEQKNSNKKGRKKAPMEDTIGESFSYVNRGKKIFSQVLRVFLE